jgi:chemotaxis receptor (MCP) glutamine deamidase CheD
MDRFGVTSEDNLLVAQLDASMALCFYDAVEEPGLLLHLRVLPHGNVNSDLTDSVFTGNLVMLEQARQALQRLAPNARYWQCKLIAQLPQDDVVTGRAASSVIEFMRHYFEDSKIKLIDAQVREGAACEVQFRPAMGEVRIKS